MTGIETIIIFNTVAICANTVIMFISSKVITKGMKSDV